MRGGAQFLLTLIFPAFNEANRIADAIRHAREYFEQRGYTNEHIVSADGTDGTREVAQEAGRGIHQSGS